MNKDIHLQYTEEMTKLSVLYYCWAVTGKLFSLAVALSVFSLFFLIHYDGSQMVISLIIFTLLWVPAFLGLLYFLTRRRALKRFHSLDNGKALFGMTDDHFSIIADSVSATLPWTAITKISKHPDFWIILLRPNGHFTLPLRNFLPEDKQFILSKIARKDASST